MRTRGGLRARHRNAFLPEQGPVQGSSRPLGCPPVPALGSGARGFCPFSHDCAHPSPKQAGCLEARDSGQGVGCFSRGPRPELVGNHGGQVWPAPTVLPEMGTKETGPLGSRFWLGRLHSLLRSGGKQNNDWKESCLQPALPFTWLGRWGTF